MKTILLVDDEQMMLDLLSLYLTPLGYNCIKTESAKAAIHYLESYSVDLILLDIMMPEMDGWMGSMSGNQKILGYPYYYANGNE